MKNKLLIKLIAAIALFWVIPFGANAQAPTYICQVRNDVQLSPTEYQFDIYLQHTGGAASFQLAGIQSGFKFNNAVIPAGATITPTIISGASDLLTCSQPKQANITIVNYGTPASKGIKITAPTPVCGAGNGTVISQTAPGMLVCRVKLTCSAPWVSNEQMNLQWNFSTPTPWPSKVFYYTTISVDCTVPANHTYNLINAPLNPPTGPTVFNVTGGGTICQGSTTTIGLSNSESAFSYQLMKDGLASGTPLVGTGAPLLWTVGDGGAYTVMAGTTSMSGSASVIVNPVVTHHENASACDTYTWARNGQTYTASGDYTYNDGCDAYILHLTITASSTNEVTETACDSYTWPLNSMTYTTSGDYTDVNGCVTTILHLTITPSSTVEVTEAACDSYTWALNSMTYTASGDYTYVNGCVTNVLHLTITPSSTVEVTETACDSYTWALNGMTYTASGDYTYVVGCVTNILHLTINPTTLNEIWHTACDEFLVPIANVLLTQSGDYPFVDGCTTYLLHLTITPSSTVEVTASACDSYTWALDGNTYTASGDYTYVNGCATTILHLTITPSSTIETTIASCGSYTWALNGMTYTASGDYTNVNGCVTNILHLTINPNVVPLFPLTYGPYNVGDVPQALPTVSQNGVAGTWNPAVVSTAAVGSAVYTFTPAGGCASPITRTISVINPVLQFTFTQDIGTTLQVSFPQVAGGNIYVVQYSLTPTGPWIGKAAYGSVVKIINLTPGTTYYWRAYGYNAAGYQISSVPVTPYTTSTVSFENLQDIGSTNLLSWSDYSTWASNYVLQYKVAGAPAWTSVMTTINEKKLSNLTPLTSYDVRVGVYKGGVLWGTSAATTFTTGTVNYLVTGITGTSATLTWNATLTDVTTWTNASVINYRPVGSGSWLGKSVLSNANTATLTGLTPSTNYEFIVYPYQASILWGPMKLGTFTTTAGTKEVSSNSDMNIYPNPFTNQVSMSFFAEEATTITWNVYDMTGKVVLNGTESVTAGYSTLDIDGANLPTGVYTLNAVMNDKVENFRIIKQ
jgi:hypothetical protein